MNKAIAFAQGAQLWATRFWRGLPHQVQAVIVVFASGAGTYAGTALFSPGSCWAWACIKHALGASVGAGGVALRAFYMRPGPGPHAGETAYTGS